MDEGPLLSEEGLDILDEVLDAYCPPVDGSVMNVPFAAFTGDVAGGEARLMSHKDEILLREFCADHGYKLEGESKEARRSRKRNSLEMSVKGCPREYILQRREWMRAARDEEDEEAFENLITDDAMRDMEIPADERLILLQLAPDERRTFLMMSAHKRSKKLVETWKY